MTQAEIEAIIDIANIHEARIKQAIGKVGKKFPLDALQVTKLTEDDLFAIEMLTSRFAKLQDYMGTTVFDLLFKIDGENTETWTPIDKLNKLEKYKLIEDAHIWRDIRKSRNFLTHEYPNEPEIIAAGLNKIYSFVPELLKVKNNILQRIRKDISKLK